MCEVVKISLADIQEYHQKHAMAPTMHLTATVLNRMHHATVTIYRPGMFRSKKQRVEPKTVGHASFRVSTVDQIFGRRYQYFYLVLESGTDEKECKAIRVKCDWVQANRIIVCSGYVIKMEHLDGSGALDVEVATLSFNHLSLPEELLREELRRGTMLSACFSSTSSERNLGDRSEASCSESFLDGECSPLSRRQRIRSDFWLLEIGRQEGLEESYCLSTESC